MKNSPENVTAERKTLLMWQLFYFAETVQGRKETGQYIKQVRQAEQPSSLKRDNF